ncbi:MAG: hypothetical protein N2112_06850 [Gemmataceae bacterium]|jgi:hypothetical protein|nr:hypothetical protein [Gemmataceae bacterium]
MTSSPFSLSVNPTRFQLSVKQLSAACCRFEIQLIDPQAGEVLRGQVTGPHSDSTSVIQLAYPCQPHPHYPERVEVIIPEPNFWEETTRLYYRAELEIWQHQQKTTQETLILRLGRSGMITGKPQQKKSEN